MATEPVPPPHLTERQYDIFLLCAEKDTEIGERFQEIIEQGIRLKTGEFPEVCLLTGAWTIPWESNDLDRFREAWNRSTLTFLLMTENFTRDSWAKSQANQCIMGSIYREAKHSSTIPIFTEPKHLNKIEPVFGLMGVRGVEISKLLETNNVAVLPTRSVAYKSIKALLDQDKIIDYKQQRKMSQVREKEKWLEETRHRLIMEHLKQLNENELNGKKKREEIAELLKFPQANNDGKTIYNVSIGHVDGDVHIASCHQPMSSSQNSHDQRSEVTYDIESEGSLSGINVSSSFTPLTSDIIQGTNGLTNDLELMIIEDLVDLGAVNDPVTVNHLSASIGDSENMIESITKSNESGTTLKLSSSSIDALSTTNQTSSPNDLSSSSTNRLSSSPVNDSSGSSPSAKTSGANSVCLKTPSGVSNTTGTSGTSVKMGTYAPSDPILKPKPFVAVAPFDRSVSCVSESSRDFASHVSSSGAGPLKGKETEAKERIETFNRDELRSFEDPDETHLKREVETQEAETREIESVETTSEEETDPKTVAGGD